MAGVCTFFQQWLFFRTAEVLSAKLRLFVLEKIMRQDIAYFDEERHNTGYLTTAVSEWVLLAYPPYILD